MTDPPKVVLRNAHSTLGFTRFVLGCKHDHRETCLNEIVDDIDRLDERSNRIVKKIADIAKVTEDHVNNQAQIINFNADLHNAFINSCKDTFDALANICQKQQDKIADLEAELRLLQDFQYKMDNPRADIKRLKKRLALLEKDDNPRPTKESRIQ
jgi:hypothetical protein